MRKPKALHEACLSYDWVSSIGSNLLESQSGIDVSELQQDVDFKLLKM